MKAFKIILLAVICFICSLNVNAQVVRILNANINSNYITPGSLSNVTVMNTYGSGQFVFQAVILNSYGIPVLEILSQPFILNEGSVQSLNNKLSLVSVNYSNDYIGEFINTHKSLPQGKYTYCCFLQPVSGGTDVSVEEFCEDLESDINHSINLISPYNRDTINTIYPLLIWNTLPFNKKLSNGEYYQLIVCEIVTDQNPEEAILINKPVLAVENLKNTQLNYPPNEEKLRTGYQYAWQVSKVVQNEIIATSEVWAFFIDEPRSVPQSYIIPKKSEDAGFFYLKENKFYVKFTEPAENNILFCRIKGADLKADKNRDTDIMVSHLGYNIYEINVERMKLKKGSYTMEIMNHLNDKYYVKFYVESKL